MAKFKRTNEERERVALLLSRRKRQLNDTDWTPPKQNVKSCAFGRLSKIYHSRKQKRGE